MAPTLDDEKTSLDKLRDVHEAQGRDGNWDYSNYMCGLFNGLELALSIFEGERDPQYRAMPEGGWRCDRAASSDPASEVEPG